MDLAVSDRSYYGLSEHMHHVPWRTGYLLGAGIDVVTGTSARGGVKAFVLPPSPRPHVASKTRIMLCESEEDIRNAVSFSTAAALACFNVEPLNLHATFGGSLEALRGIRKSSTSLSLLVVCTKQWGDQYGAHFELTDEALTRARQHPTTFRDVYGDYFIAGVTAGALFTAVLTWTCLDRETRKALEIDLQTKLNIGPVAAGFDSRVGHILSRLAQEKRVQVSIQVGMRGTDSAATQSSVPMGWHELTEISQIFEPLAWFQQHAVGEPVSAILYPYARAAFPEVLPHDLPVQHAVFQELAAIRDTLLQCQIRVDSIPSPLMRFRTISRIRNECISLGNQCADYYQPRLPYDDPTRQQLLSSLLGLLAKLREFEAIQDFFLAVRAKGDADSQLAGRLQDAREGKTWEYGSSSPSAAGDNEFITILKLEPQVRTVKGWLWPKSAHEFVTICPATGEHIVGYSVTSLQPHGSWRKVTQQIILSREATVKLRRGFRASTWRFTVYVIKNEFFDILCQNEPGMNGSTLDTYEGVNASRS